MNEKILWAVGGLVLGSVISAGAISLVARHELREGSGAMWQRSMSKEYKGMMQDKKHMMPNGEMMMDKDMMSSKPNSMDSMMMDMNAALKGKTGDELDKAFLEEMIVHHQGAVEMAKLLTNGKHEELKKFGEEIISAQSKEIKQMQDWQKAWYPVK